MKALKTTAAIAILIALTAPASAEPSESEVNANIMGQCMGFIGAEVNSGNVTPSQAAYMLKDGPKAFLNQQMDLAKKYPKCFESTATKTEQCLKSKKVKAEKIQFFIGYTVGLANANNSNYRKAFLAECRD
jgi:hypothetical protein